MMRDILEKNQMALDENFANDQAARKTTNAQQSRYRKTEKASNQTSLVGEDNLNSDTEKLNIQKIKDKMRDEG